MDSGQHELGQGSLAVVPYRVEEAKRVLAQLARFEVAAFPVQDQAAVDVDEGGPEVIALAHENRPRPGEEVQGPEGLTLAAYADREVGERLGHLVWHLESLESGQGLLGQGASLVEGGQLERPLGLMRGGQRAGGGC